MIRVAGRVLLRMLAFASLLVCVAAAGAWGLSYWRAGDFVFVAGERSVAVQSEDQAIYVMWSSRPFFHPRPWSSRPATPAAPFREFFHFRREVEERSTSPAHTYQWLGFYLWSMDWQFPKDHARDVRFGAAAVPYYFIFWAAALLPAIRIRRALVRRRRRRRFAAGRCGACGYDCRATPDRCPECGAVRPVEAAEKTAAAALLRQEGED